MAKIAEHCGTNKIPRICLILGVSSEATTRFELVIRVLQTHALPLGYVALYNALFLVPVHYIKMPFYRQALIFCPFPNSIQTVFRLPVPIFSSFYPPYAFWLGALLQAARHSTILGYCTQNSAKKEFTSRKTRFSSYR